MIGDYERAAALFTDDGAVRMPHIPAEFVGREQMRTAIERRQGERLLRAEHTPGHHPARGRYRVRPPLPVGAVHQRNGNSNLHYGIYHDRYQRTLDGWKFKERVYEIRCVDLLPQMKQLGMIQA